MFVVLTRVGSGARIIVTLNGYGYDARIGLGFTVTLLTINLAV